MSSVFVDCWKCDECGHRWIKTGAIPTHCASSKCRKRSWNKKERSNGVEDENQISARPGNGDRCAPSGHSPGARAEPDSVCGPKCSCGAEPYIPTERAAIDQTRVNGNAAMLTFLANLPAPIIEPSAEHEVPICLFDWWEDGEHYQCLMDKGHKSPKHGQHGAVRKVGE